MTWQLTEETKQRMSKSKMGMRNPNWVGDAITYKPLHAWIRRRLPMPPRCNFCNENEPRDLANRTGIYNRDFTNWWFLCRKCHMELDSRIHQLRNQ